MEMMNSVKSKNVGYRKGNGFSFVLKMEDSEDPRPTSISFCIQFPTVATHCVPLQLDKQGMQKMTVHGATAFETEGSMQLS